MNYPSHPILEVSHAGDGEPASGYFFKIEMMCFREVATRVIRDDDPDYLKECPDCGAPSTIVVIELATAQDISPQPRVWGWCGQCSIGG